MKIEKKKDPQFYFKFMPIQYLIRRFTHYPILENRKDIGRRDWALFIIGSADFIEGATRIQKYGFLGARTIKGLVNRGFYNDWIAGKYGPFSPSLAQDIDSLLSSGLIVNHKVKNNYDYWVDRFALTDLGRVRYNAIKHYEEKLIEELKKRVIDHYANKSLMDILHDVYYQFPEYAMASTIKSDVGRKIYESDSYLNTQMDEPDSEY